jgi:hypothetical protein
MATRQLKALTEKGTHAVGNLCSLKIRTIPYGAIVEGADIDNFTLVELGFNADGERTCKQLSDVTKKSYLIASPEVRNMGEEMVDFYNAVGEYARIVILDEGLRFDTSAYQLNTGVTEIQQGQVAHFDPATKKFIISSASSPHADYANARAKFLVVHNEEDLEYTNGMPLVRLEVIES